MAGDENLVLAAREVEFDWSEVPLQWVPGDPFSSHMMDVAHLLLPTAERWFIDMFTRALPSISDDKVAADARGFIGQESMHAKAHQGAADHLCERGLDARPYLDKMARFFEEVLGDRGYTGRKAEEWLVDRLALVAAGEHLTAVLGDWLLNSPGLDAAHADPVMVDLLRWHGAEEVEHRCVAFDVYDNVDGRYLRRVTAMVVVVPGLLWLWLRGLRFLLDNDPGTQGRRCTPLAYLRASRRGTLPKIGAFARSIAAYFRPGFHPRQEFDTEQALAYLSTSPAARTVG